MRKILFALTAMALFFAGCTTENGNLGNEPDSSQEPTFTDPIFLMYLLDNFDRNNDSKISKEEAYLVTCIDVSNKYYAHDSDKIRSLQGIEHFTNLRELYCEYNLITDLDLSKNTQLTKLECGGNNLTSIDLSKNTQLTELLFGFNNLTSIDLSKNTLLTDLGCDYNNLTKLDVSRTSLGQSGGYLSCYMDSLQKLYLRTGWIIDGINYYRSPDQLSPNTEIVYVDY